MKWLMIIGIAAGLAGGCVNDSGNPGSESLAGTQWRLTAWSVSSLNPAEFSITLDFGKSDISGRSAVNTYGGPYTVTRGGGFSVGEIHSTLMGASEESMRAESLYFELLAQVRKYSVTQTRLTLMNEGNQELLIFQSR